MKSEMNEKRKIKTENLPISNFSRYIRNAKPNSMGVRSLTECIGKLNSDDVLIRSYIFS